MMAQLQLTLVASKLTLSDVKRQLQNLPKTATALYEASFQRICQQEPERRKLALKILTWVCYSLRPLDLQELQHAISLQPNCVSFDADNIVRREDITAFCAGLVVVTQTNCVTLVHPTAKEYFNSTKERDFPHAFNDIVSICATHLAIVCSNGSHDFDSFTSYVIGYMGKHVQDAEALPHTELTPPSVTHGEQQVQLTQVCEEGTTVILSAETYDQLYSLTKNPASRHVLCPKVSRISSDLDSSISPTGRFFGAPTSLHYAATLGICGVMRLLVEATTGTALLDAETGSHETALSIAMKSGFTAIVLYLVQEGARINLLKETDRDIFLIVLSQGYIEIVKTVLTKAVEDAKAHPNRKGSKGIQLLGAAYHGNVEEIKQLFRLSFVNPIHKSDGFCNTALLIAAHQNDQKAIAELLKHGADISVKDSKGRTALHRAAVWGNRTLVEFLIIEHAKVDVADNHGLTPWAEVCTMPDREDIAVLLLANGADPNTRGREGCSILYSEAAGGNIDGVRKMLVSGTDPSIATNYGWCPLVSDLI
jgi:ankyrin repeat protein